ncbi:MAG: hypothetical protein GY765_02460 [bacterium]|nr:hypothetical protein [bacterium]
MKDIKNTPYKQEVGERLEIVRKHLGLDVWGMKKLMNVSEWTYRHQIIGDHLPSLASLRSLAVQHKVSLDWVYYSRGEMICTDTKAEMQKAVKAALEAEREEYRAKEEERKKKEAERQAEIDAHRAVKKEKREAIRLIRANDPFHRELEEMTYIMEWVPMVRHSIMGYFQKVKLEHKDLIREELDQVEKEKKNKDADKVAALIKESEE